MMDTWTIAVFHRNLRVSSKPNMPKSSQSLSFNPFKVLGVGPVIHIIIVRLRIKPVCLVQNSENVAHLRLRLGINTKQTIYHQNRVEIERRMNSVMLKVPVVLAVLVDLEDLVVPLDPEALLLPLSPWRPIQFGCF